MDELKKVAAALAFLGFALNSTAAVAREGNRSASVCLPAGEAPAPIIDRSYFFPGLLEPKAMHELFDDFQKSGKRFEYRGHMRGGRYLVPYSEQNVTGQKLIDTVEFPKTLIKAIQTHMSESFKAGFAKYPFLPDMGHGHLLVPAKVLAKAKADGLSAVATLQAVLSSPELEILYHVNELLKYEDADGHVSAEIAYMRDNRNIIASVANPSALVTHAPQAEPPAKMKDLVQQGQFYMTLNQNGCLPATFAGAPTGMDLSIVGPSWIPKPAEDDGE